MLTDFLLFISKILLPAIFVCIAMAVSKIRPSIVMPALELNTDMFLDVDPSVHYLPFSYDDPNSVMTQDMTDILVQYPGVGKMIAFLFTRGVFFQCCVEYYFPLMNMMAIMITMMMMMMMMIRIVMMMMMMTTIMTIVMMMVMMIMMTNMMMTMTIMLMMMMMMTMTIVMTMTTTMTIVMMMMMMMMMMARWRR